MPTKQEIDKIIAWCEHKLAEKGRPSIERNPFTREIKWMEKFALIYIDIRKETAPNTSLVYDSEYKTLWQFIGREWCPIFEDLAGKK